MYVYIYYNYIYMYIIIYKHMNECKFDIICLFSNLEIIEFHI